MKSIYNISKVGILLAGLFLSGCSDILDENPRAVFTPDFFKTEAGVKGGITSLYAHLRYIYGQGYYYNSCQTGTDESTYAQSADANFKDMDFSGAGTLTASSSRSDALWSAAFPNINTANGIVENASAVGISDALIAEARFFRAFDYFLLVQTFGGVPLDLGSGVLKFNITPSRKSVRNTVPEVYTKAIFPDLVKAVNDLPDAARVTGGVTKTLARLYLAKAYLTYGWWLENSNNIPTYPDCSRVDPDGHDAQWYFNEAYNVALQGIQNPGTFKLQATYFDVNNGASDRNSEILLYADHTQASEYFNGGSLTYGSGNAPDNFSTWMVTWNYTNLKSATTADWKTTVNSVQREAAQGYGRPWTRMCPTIGVITNTFADKVNDSRYDGTFATVYRGNWTKNPGNANIPFVYNANGLKVYPGEAVLSFLNDEPVQAIDYSNSVYKSGIGAGILPGRADFVVAPSGISRIVYPGIWKLGTYRTDNGTGLGQPNAASTRPYNIAKFSELYFVAAEAAVKGATVQPGFSARELINVIRARAGKWSWSNADNAVKVADNSAAMASATPASISIDFILAERSREYYGEGYRWFDLVRTQKWAELSGSFQICGSNYGDHTPVTVSRTIKPEYYLRPIPQGQIDGMELSDADKVAYQNPAYR